MKILAKAAAIFVPIAGSVCLQVVPFVELERVFLQNLSQCFFQQAEIYICALRNTLVH